MDMVILLGAPLTEQNISRVGFHELREKLSLKIFDCMPLLGRTIENFQLGNIDPSTIIKIDSFHEFEYQLEKLRPKFALDFIASDEHILVLGKLLKKFNTTLVVQKTGNIPAPRKIDVYGGIFSRSNKPHELSVLSSGEMEKFLTHPRKVVFKLASRFRQKINRVCESFKFRRLQNVVGLLAGNASLNSFTKNCKQIIWVASNDYYIFNQALLGRDKRNLDEMPSEFILFMDDSLPSASDWEVLGLKPPVTSNIYFMEMNNFFSNLEKMLNAPVVIAAHPNAKNISELSANFGFRRVVYNNSAQCALKTFLILVHASTATSFAVLARKPIISITTNELLKSNYQSYVGSLSRELGSKLINISTDFDSGQIRNAMNLDLKKYDAFRRNYIINEFVEEEDRWESLIWLVKSSSG